MDMVGTPARHLAPPVSPFFVATPVLSSDRRSGNASATGIACGARSSFVSLRCFSRALSSSQIDLRHYHFGNRARHVTFLQQRWRGRLGKLRLILGSAEKKLSYELLCPTRRWRGAKHSPFCGTVQCNAGGVDSWESITEESHFDREEKCFDEGEDGVGSPEPIVSMPEVPELFRNGECEKPSQQKGAPHLQELKSSELRQPSVHSYRHLSQMGSQSGWARIAGIASGLIVAVGLGLATLHAKKSFGRQATLRVDATPVAAASLHSTESDMAAGMQNLVHTRDSQVEQPATGAVEEDYVNILLEQEGEACGGKENEGADTHAWIRAAIFEKDLRRRLSPSWQYQQAANSIGLHEPEGLPSLMADAEFGNLVVLDEGDGRASVGSSSLQDTEDAGEEDAELEQEFRERLSKPRPLTVPLRIVSLRGSVPPLWVREFIMAQGKNARLKLESKGDLGGIVKDLSSALKSKKADPKSAIAADLVTIGDAWLSHAIASGVLSPLKGAERSEWFQRLSPTWQALLRRDESGRMSSQGAVYAAPYRWGATLIAYRADELAKHSIAPITCWADLWRPELAGKVAMVDSPREVVGATLKSLGASANAKNFDAEVPGGREAVARRFNALQGQVKLYDNIHYLKALGAGDVWVAVGWSNDLLPYARRSSHVTVVAPREGTSLWADLWAVPATTRLNTGKLGGRIRGPSPLASQWVDFCLQPARAGAFQQEIFVGAPPSQLPWLKKGHETHLDLATGSALDRGTPSIATGVSAKGLSDIPPFDHTSERAVELRMQGEQIGAVKEPEPNSANGAMSGVARTQKETETNLVKGVPVVEVLSKSEFLEPLSESALEDHRWLLTQRPGVEVIGWHGRIEKLLGMLLPSKGSSK